MARHPLSGYKREPQAAPCEQSTAFIPQTRSLCTQVSLNTHLHTETLSNALLTHIKRSHCIVGLCESLYVWTPLYMLPTYVHPGKLLCEGLSNKLSDYRWCIEWLNELLSPRSRWKSSRITWITRTEGSVTTCCSDISEPEHLLHVTHPSSGPHVLCTPWITTIFGRCYYDVARQSFHKA